MSIGKYNVLHINVKKSRQGISHDNYNLLVISRRSSHIMKYITIDYINKGALSHLYLSFIAFIFPM